MPHQRADRLYANEVLVPGETLVSEDGRFRLEFLPDGMLQFRHFVDHMGVVTKFRKGPGIRLTMDEYCDYVQVGGVRQSRGRPRLEDASGKVIWEAGPLQFQRCRNHDFVVQSDGNVAFNGIVGETPFPQWGMVVGHLPDRLYGRAAAVIPNTTTVNIGTTGAVLINTTGQGQGEVLNILDKPIGIRCESNYLKIDPGAAVSIAHPGVVDLSTSQYNFDDATASVTTRHNGDAIAMSPSPNGRWKLEVGGAGLLLRVPIGPAESDVVLVPIAEALRDGFPISLTERPTAVLATSLTS
ncbi:MAG: hypothetical protein KDA75_01875 [Planctomycetaceae bacterium]|nr:hypothetical protein [Planctomycetaceae bacterium]